MAALTADGDAMKKRYRVWVDLNVSNRSEARSILPFDGVNYELTAIPYDKQFFESGDATFGGEENEPAISLGPRGGGVCPCCGR